MQRKWLIAGVLGLALLAVCGATLLVFWSSVGLLANGGVRIEGFGDAAVSATATEEQRFTVSDGASLDLTTLSGDVVVTGGAGNEIVVTANKTGWGRDDADAQVSLDDLVVTMEQTGNTVTVKVDRPSQFVLAGIVREGRVDFTVQVPSDAAVDASTTYGDVSASGLTGGAVLASNSGEVSASGLEGEVEMRSGYGDVTLEQAEPDTVTARSSSGTVSLEQVDANGSVELYSGYGNVSFESGTAEAVEASTSSGSVTLTDLNVAGAVEARSDYGDVTVTRVAAPGGYTLESSSGDVDLDGAAGRVSAESGYGNVSVTNAADVTLSLLSRSGAVSFAGSLGAGPHTLHSNYGNVSLLLPPDTAADIELSTGYGSIRSAFPITLSGDIEEEHWQGTLNGGGVSLTVRTDSGSITLDILNQS
jgi:DUF4097 and DUF4098 domain-containing protein YvlB